MDDLGRWMRRVLDEVAPPVDPRSAIAGIAPRRRRVWPIAVVAAVVVVLLVGGGYWLFSGAPSSQVADDTTTTTTGPGTTTTSPVEPVTLDVLQPVSIACTAELPEFPCTNLIDGDSTTEWQAPNGGIGAVITIEFAEPVSIEGVRFFNIGDDTQFMRNGRIREMRITAYPSLAIIHPNLADSNDAPAEFGHSDWLAVTSLEIEPISGYPGTSVGDLPPFAELALAEIEVVGYAGGVAPPSEPTTTTLGEAEPLTGTWFKTNPDLGGLYVQVRDLIWDGEAFYLLTRLGFGDLIVWRSPDGIEWDEYSQIGTSGVTEGPWHLVSVDGHLVAGGRRELVATVWIQEEDTWREVVVAPSGSIRALAYRQGVYVAFGTAPAWDESPEGPPPAHNAVIWTSADAVTWSEVAGVGVFGNNSQAQALMDGGAGFVAVVARGDFPREPMTFVVAISQDGTGWTTRATTGLAVSQIDAVGNGAASYIIGDGLTGVAYESGNGTTWSPVFDRLPEAGDRGYLSDVELFRDQIVMSGYVFVDPGGGAYNYMLPAVWVYLGGDSWAPLGSMEWFDQPGVTYRIVTAPDRLVVIGEHGTDEWALFTFVIDEP